MTTATINGITMAYDAAGSGDDVLLLIHGHPFDRSMWRGQLAAASGAGWCAVAPDLRGYGESGPGGGARMFSQFAEDLAALLDHLDVTRAVVGGLSMGGQIAMEFCRRYPQRVRGLLLAATFPQAESEEGKQRRNAMANRLLREGMAGYAEEVLPQMLAARSIAQQPHVADYVLEMMRRAPPIGAAAALRSRAERPPYEAVLAALAVPALVVVGDADAFTTHGDAECMHDLLRGSRLLWLEGVGHMPNLESEAAFNGALVAFLETIAVAG